MGTNVLQMDLMNQNIIRSWEIKRGLKEGSKEKRGTRRECEGGRFSRPVTPPLPPFICDKCTLFQLMQCIPFLGLTPLNNLKNFAFVTGLLTEEARRAKYISKLLVFIFTVSRFLVHWMSKKTWHLLVQVNRACEYYYYYYRKDNIKLYLLLF